MRNRFFHQTTTGITESSTIGNIISTNCTLGITTHLLDLFLKLGAISQAQHDKSLHDLTEKMGVVSGEREASSRETDSCRRGEESET